jgi:hypothetical protein
MIAWKINNTDNKKVEHYGARKYCGMLGNDREISNYITAVAK